MCGLPIVSSKRSFNDGILDETNSIRIDPENIDEISNAIELLYNDASLRMSLAQGSLEKAKGLSINNRAKKIIDFMERMK